MDRGYIKLWRKVAENPVLHERGKRFSRFEAWIWLCLQARGADDQKTGLTRGQFAFSYRSMADSWRWSLASVQRFFADLETGPDPMIMRVIHSSIHSPIQLGVRFNICKYELYNPVRDSNRYTNRYSKRYTPDNLQEATPLESKRKTGTESAIKEGFNEVLNKEIKAADAAVDSLPSVQSFQLSAKLKAAIASRDPRARAARVPDLTGWARDIDKLMRIDGRRAEDIEAVIAWCQSNGCFWGPNILSGRSLREKFDTMFGQMMRGEHGDSRRGTKPDRVGEERIRSATHEADFLPGGKYWKGRSQNPDKPANT